jgi:ferredoxin
MSTKAAYEAIELPFINALNECYEEIWTEAINRLAPSIHEVDRNATQIWFKFYPLGLFEVLNSTEDEARLAQELLLQGNYHLAQQIDSSHKFLYGHRYWPAVKAALITHAGLPQEGTFADHVEWLVEQVVTVARGTAASLKVDQAVLIGITVVAFMTLRQTGLAAFKAAPGKMLLDKKQAQKTPEQILKERAKDDSQGLFGFLKTVDKKWTVVFDENDPAARYKLNHAQDLAWGAADDRSRDWVKLDPRCIEGPIPVECRSASCGTCWVGVLGGAEKLADVAARESKKIKEFGYIDTDEPKPLIRLACQAQAEGAVSIVIPPWNGQFGKYLRSQKNDMADDNESGHPEETVN